MNEKKMLRINCLELGDVSQKKRKEKWLNPPAMCLSD